MENLSSRQRRVIVAIFASIIVLGVGILAFVQISRIGKIAATVKYAPYNATVKLDGERISNNSTVYVVPGEYELVVEVEYFDTVEKKITVSEEYPYVIGEMIPNSDMGEQIARERLSEFLDVESIFGNLTAAEGAKEKEQYPILKYLPVNNALFSISYEYDKSGNLQVNIKASQTYRNTAVSKLYSFENVDPAQYNVIFKDFVNPFDGTFVKNTASDPKEFLAKGYGSVMGEDYVVRDVRNDGEYYYTTIETEIGQQDGFYASWRVLMRKSGGSWDLVTTPYPVLTKYNTPDVSTELLNKINRLE